MTATDIADLIDLLADFSARGAQWSDAEIKRYSNLNRALWELARNNGIKDEVDSILQERSMLAMFEAMDKIS
jgi:hypothetical protein